jgi:rfaE bifunctional protein kinase chain/domain
MKSAFADLIKTFPRRRILVIGDIMLDEYLWGHIERISPEAPVPVMRLERREERLGGAGNVMQNVAGLGAQVIALGVVGDNSAGNLILKALADRGIDQQGIVVERGRVSTRKCRLMSGEHGQQVFRFDEETQSPVEGETEDRLIAAFDSQITGADTVVCSDYLKGALTTRVLNAVFTAARKLKKTVIVAPKDSDSRKYDRADVLVANAKELSQLAQVSRNGENWISVAAEALMRRIETNSLLVTLGSEGMSLFELLGNTVRRANIPTVARSVYDVTGAGDTVVAVFSLAVASGANNEDAARLANIAAGIVVGRRGTVCVTPDELVDRIHEEAAHAFPLVQSSTSGT